MAQRNARLSVPTMPDGTEVASYHTYIEAQGAVDFLSDNGFDVKSITIVGTDLHMVERVTGRLTMGKIAASGAGSGALWGSFMGLMLSFAATSQGAALWLLIGIGGGALAGTLMSLALYSAAGGQRDFTSQSQVVASRYAVLASAQIDQAFQLLQKTPGNQMRPIPRRTRAASSGPSEYGSRPGERPRFGVRLSASEKEHEEATGEAPGAELREKAAEAGGSTPATGPGSAPPVPPAPPAGSGPSSGDPSAEPPSSAEPPQPGPPSSAEQPQPGTPSADGSGQGAPRS